jgi:hypothetical protein
LKTNMLLALLAALALVAAPAAYAGDRVLVVGSHGMHERWDPTLPPDTAPAPPPGTPATPPPAHPAGGPTVRQSLDRALAAGTISQARHERYTQDLREARAAYRMRKVDVRCRTQIGRVLAIMSSISQRGLLVAARMPALFRQLRRNTEFWTREPSVGIGERVTFEDEERDPLIFQHYTGYGLQIQPLGNFGKANGLWNQCRDTPADCHEKTLHALLESMVEIASWRAGAKAWEYWFPFGGGYPPWASGMAQATGMQALSRGAVFFGEPRFMMTAQKALPLFTKPPPAGVRVAAGRGYHYLLYSFAPGLRVLNAFLQAITGLHDYAELNRDERARNLFRRGDREARREVPRYDTGNWSYYALPNKNLSTWDYHVLVTGFLENLCERTGARVYCRTARRFTKYSDRRGGPPPPGTGGPKARCGYL